MKLQHCSKERDDFSLQARDYELSETMCKRKRGGASKALATGQFCRWVSSSKSRTISVARNSHLFPVFLGEAALIAQGTQITDNTCRCMRFRSSRRLGATYLESTYEFGRENCRAVEWTTAWWLCSERLMSSRDRRSWDARRQALWLRWAFLVRETGIAEAQARDLIDMLGNNQKTGLFI
ncbi:hypothetical protein MPL3365_140256 [Mesorhizobium plurifarium]|uniref:Uncharacterized protein n=1 Tax=Mesorhizobium plurifarium TaxID=69974 RepID=A0A090G4J2_MESPL|nr:hypothetical protein MPL3365_140256 [Mesorhizobium plurifarium]